MSSLDRKGNVGVSSLSDRADFVASCVLGTVLIMSAIPHLGNPYFFLGAVYAYNLVDARTGQWVALVLPFLELVVAVCLTGRVYRDAAHCIALGLFASFLLLQSTAYMRGLGISCACFGARYETTIGVASLATVSGLFLLSVLRNGRRWRDLLGHRSS